MNFHAESHFHGACQFGHILGRATSWGVNMPIYEFVCGDCGEKFDELCAVGASASCPHCGSSNTSRLISAPGPLAKGAFPFKPGKVHPLAGKMAAGGAGCHCGSTCPGRE